MAIKNTKSVESYKAEYNNLVRGATAMLERASVVRKNIGIKDGKKFHTEGKTGKALASVVTTVKGLKTYKGDGERNPA